MDTYIKLNEEFERLYIELENDNIDVEEEMIQLQEKVRDELENIRGEENIKLRNLFREIKKAKKEFDFFELDNELDNMFPNRNDSDFDEDSMSYESVFGE